MLDEAVHEILLYFLGNNQISIMEIAFLNAGPFYALYSILYTQNLRIKTKTACILHLFPPTKNVPLLNGIAD